MADRTAEQERADVVAWFRTRAAELDRLSRDSAQGERRWGYHERAELLEDEADDIEAGAHVGAQGALADGYGHDGEPMLPGWYWARGALSDGEWIPTRWAPDHNAGDHWIQWGPRIVDVSLARGERGSR